MNDVFLGFEWSVSPGYRWQPWMDPDGTPVVVPDEGFASLESYTAVQKVIEQSGKTGPVLEPVLESGPARSYQPMHRDHAALFRTFEALDPRDRKAILVFASQYGWLGLPRQEQGFMIDAPDGAEVAHIADGEPHSHWALEIYQMKEAVRLSEHRTSKHRIGELNWLLNRPRHLRDVQCQVLARRANAKMSFQPRTLLAAMWLQLARAVVGKKGFSECKFCGSLFEVSTDTTGFRRNREFCSDVCKTRDYRQRRQTALELAADGTSLSAIADQITTKKATVQRWIDAATTGQK